MRCEVSGIRFEVSGVNYVLALRENGQRAEFNYLIFLMKECKIFFKSVTNVNNSWKQFSEMYPRSFDNIIWYSSSEAEAEEIAKNLFISALLLWPQPSAIFVGMEELDLLI